MAFKSELTLKSIRGTDERELLSNLIYEYTPIGVVIVAPKGMKTNFASIPDFIKGWIDNDGWYIRDAAVIHDYLYSAKAYPRATIPVCINTRKLADMILRQGMKDLGASWVKRQTVYFSVRLFGNSFYKKD